MTVIHRIIQRPDNRRNLQIRSIASDRGMTVIVERRTDTFNIGPHDIFMPWDFANMTAADKLRRYLKESA